MQMIEGLSEVEIKVAQEEHRIRELKTQLNQTRRSVMPVPVSNYAFNRAGDGAEVRLSELFGDKKDLILVHNMGGGCPGCTMWADEFNGALEHLLDRAAFAVVSNDESSEQGNLVRKRGWRFPLLSARGTGYSAEAGFEGKDEGHGKYRPGVTTYAKRANGEVVRVSRSSFGPGDEFCGAFNLVALLEGGSEGWFSKLHYPNQPKPEPQGFGALEDYLRGWESQDFARMESALGSEFQFRGPMQSHDSKESFMASCRAMARNPLFQNAKVSGVKKFFLGNEVALFYDFIPQNGKPKAMAERMRLDDSGRIREIQLVFDPSGF